MAKSLQQTSWAIPGDAFDSCVRRFPPPWSVEELGACAGRRSDGLCGVVTASLVSQNFFVAVPGLQTRVRARLSQRSYRYWLAACKLSQ
jgi:hypothetical protein